MLKSALKALRRKKAEGHISPASKALQEDQREGERLDVHKGRRLGVVGLDKAGKMRPLSQHKTVHYTASCVQ